MPKILLTGPAGCGKTHQVLDEFVRAIKETDDPLSDEHFLVLPSLEHVERITTLVLARGLKGFFQERITTLEHLAQRMLRVPEEKIAPQVLRSMILRDILASYEGSFFSQIQTFPGFAELLLHFIGELKDALISAENFRARMNQMKQLELGSAEKFEALAGLYERYEERLAAEGLQDRQDLFRLRQAQPEKNPMPRKRFKAIWLDGFFDFSGLQLEYLRELSERSDHMVVTLTKDQGILRSHLFDAVIRTEQSLKTLGLEISPMENLSHRTKIPALQTLERFLFSGRRPDPAPDPGPAVRIFEAVGIQGEIEMIAREIRRQLQQKEMRLSDFAILLREIGLYEPVIRSVFAEYGLAVEIHERSRLKLSPLVSCVGSLFRILREDWKRSDLFNFLKSSYVKKINGEEKSISWICELEETAVRKRILRGRTLWLESWTGFNNSEEEKHFNAAKEKVFASLAALQDELEAASTVSQIQKILRKAWRRTFEIQPDISKNVGASMMRRETAAMARLEALMEEIRLHYFRQGKSEVRFAEFSDYFLKLVDLDLFSLPEPDKNQVQVYDVSLARQKEYRIVFVAGLLEKQFPLLIREDPVLSDWERELFNRSSGQKLSLRLLRQSIERTFFYFALTRASEQLILTYPRLDREGKESLPSFYVSEVRSIFSDQVPVTQQDLGRPYLNLDEVVDERELETAVMGGLWHAAKSEEPFLLAVTNRLLEQNSKQEVFRKAFYQIRAQLHDSAIREEDAFLTRRTSATKLEEYAKCPFKYFAHQVLALENPEDDINIKNKGTILHRILENYFKTNPAVGRKAMDLKKLALWIDRELESALKEVPLLYEKHYQFELAREEIRDMLTRFLPLEIERLAASALQPAYFEFSFGAGKNPDTAPLEWVLENGDKVSITGKIDRIDTDPKREFGLVVDYKRSVQFKKADLEFGTALQLPLYLIAAENFLKLKPVGGELYSIRECKARGFYHTSNSEGLKPLSARSLKYSAEEFQAVLERGRRFIRFFLSEMQKPVIQVKPRLCESYCPYAAVCRIEKWRLDEIRDEIQVEDRKRWPESKPAVAS